MPISRRTALQQLFIVAGGVVLLPACDRNSDKNDDNQATLAALADTLLPPGSSPTDPTLSATATGAHLFAATMIRDCYPKDQQEKYMRGLQAFIKQSHDKFGRSFAACDQTQRDALVSSINGDDLSFFFRTNKDLLIQGYLGSKYFLTKIEVYELVPGRWHGCVPVIKKS